MKKALFVVMAAGLLALAVPSKSEAALAGSFHVCQGATCVDVAGTLFGVGGVATLVGDYLVEANGSFTQNSAFSQTSNTNIGVTRVGNTSAAALDVWFTVTGYTQPVGPQFVMSAVATASKTGMLSDNVSYTAWYSSTNATGFPTGVLGGTGNCTPAPSLTVINTGCSGSTSNVAVGAGSALYSMITRTTFSIGIGNNSSLFASTGSASITAVPEPGSMMLLGTGLLGLGAVIRRRIKK